MADDEIPDWTVAEKVIAAAGLVVLGAVAAILLDVLTGGRLVRALGWCGCEGKDDDDVSGD